MPQDETKIALHYIDRFVAGDVQGTLAVLSEDVRYHVTGMPAPLSKKDVGNMMAMFSSALSGMSYDLIRQVSGDGWVSTAFQLKGTHTGTFQGIPATGRAFSVLSMNQVRVVDGKITEIQGVMDTLSLLRAIGATVVPGA